MKYIYKQDMQIKYYNYGEPNSLFCLFVFSFACWEPLPVTCVAWVQIPESTPYVG